MDRFSLRCDGELLACTRVRPAAAGLGGLLMLHGAGTATKERTVLLAQDLADQGYDVVTFDFSGHGESSGVVRELSLERRFRQAVEVADRLFPDHAALTLVGFSMSGQTVADLIGHYGRRVVTIALCSPAVYPANSWELPFTHEFTAAIRTVDAWQTSTALRRLAEYEGRAVLAVPGVDEVIPAAVTAHIDSALRTRAELTRLTFEAASHRLGSWLAENPAARARFVSAVRGSSGPRTATDGEPAPELGGVR